MAVNFKKLNFLYAGLAFVFCSVNVNCFAAEANPDLSALHGNVIQNFKNLSDSINAFQALPCLTKDATSHLGKLQSNSTQVHQALNEQFKSYMTYVQKPMQGNGRCNGGFQSVAVESENRRVKSQELAIQTKNLQMNFYNAVVADFDGVDIDMPDESEEQECARAGDKIYDAVLANSTMASQAMDQFRAGVAFEEKRFQSFSARNTGLSDDCGSLTGGAAGAAASTIATGGQRQPASLAPGDSPKPESTITGRLHRDELPAPGTGKSLSSPFGEKGNSEQTGANAASTGNSLSSITQPLGSAQTGTAPLRGNSRDSRAPGVAQRKSKGVELGQFGNRLSVEGNTKTAGISEEMKVQSILSKQDNKDHLAEATSDKGGPAGGPGYASALEVMVNAQASAEQAQPEAKSEQAKMADLANGSASGSEMNSPENNLFDRIHAVLRKKEAPPAPR